MQVEGLSHTKGQKSRREKTLLFYKSIGWFLIMISIVINSFAQSAQHNARITGKIVDAETGDEIIGANVYLEGTTIGTTSDLDGTFIINHVPPGTYTLIVQMIGYATVHIKDLNIQSGTIQKLDIKIQPQALSTEEVVVEARLLLNNEATLLKQRQKAAAVSDAISAEEFSRTGSSDAANAMRALTGASVMEGKYVLVRGLGERYSNTQLNGAELPTSDPDKKAFQFDLLPTALLDNIVTVKTFTPDKPGNFSGGLVNINTRSYPESFTLNFSNSIAYNTETSLNNNFLSTIQGGRDWLGMDDGTRALPKILRDNTVKIPSEIEARTNPEAAQILDQLSKSFLPEMSPRQRTAPLNQNYSIAMGNRLSLFGRPLGYLFSLSYKSGAKYYENGKVARWKLTGKVETNDSLTNLVDLSDRRGVQAVLWGGLGTFSYKLSPYHQFHFNMLFTRSGENEARYLVGRWPEQFLDNPNAFFETRALHYTQRMLQSYQVQGRHVFPALNKLEMEWNVTANTTLQNEPDVRFFSDNFAIRKFQGRDTVLYSISPSIYQRPGRYFRDLTEISRTMNLKFTIPFKIWNGTTAKFASGAYYLEKNRTFRERLFEYRQGSTIRYTGDPQSFFATNNTGIIGYDSLRNRYIFGNYIQESLNALGGNYDGYENITAGFFMVDLPLYSHLRFIGGLRYETTRLTVSDIDTAGYLNTNDWLPSVNLVYTIFPNSNLRLAYGKTLARPNFREKAPYASYLFMNDVIFQGNIGLQRTLIDNYDVRFEWFPRSGELIAISGFYKYFNQPIERVINLLYASEGAIVKYENVDHAVVYGMELEVRKQLDEIWSALKHFAVATNISLIHSRVNIPADELRLIRELNPNAADTRPLQGQSPYIVNAELIYNHPEQGTQASLYFNVFGERLAEVSLGGTPNVFEQPRPELNFNISQRIKNGMRLSFRAQNILNSSFRMVQHYKGHDYIRQEYSTGRTFSIGLTYNL